MKINKIYSNMSSMQTIRFKDGLNIIYGDIEKVTRESDNEHNLGKTSLVHLINFLLLKGISKDDIFVKFKEKFKGWEFYLEITLEKGKYLTIKRSIDKPTLISFKEHQVFDQNYIRETVWDYKDTKLFSKKGNDSIGILEQYLKFDVGGDYNIRQFLNYSLRTQNDYADVFKMKQSLGGDIEWKPFLFKLLGYDEVSVVEKYKIQNELSILKSMIKSLARSNGNKSEDIFRLKAVIAEKEREKKDMKNQVNKFDFYFKENQINTDLVEKIEGGISNLNSERYRLDYEVNKINDSLANNTTVDLADIDALFDEVSIYFPDSLRKNYQELIAFNKSITKERAYYLKEELAENITRLESISHELKKLNSDKMEALAILQETDTFQKFKLLQCELIKSDEQLVKFKQRLSELDTVEVYKKRIDILKSEAIDWTSKTKENIDKGNPVFDEIKAIFSDIFKITMRSTAVLVLVLNKEGNPEFESITLNNNEIDEITGEAKGCTATKVQCAAFVLSVLCKYSTRRFYKFAYHDGLFEGWGDEPKKHFIDYVRNLSDRYGIQYIVSMIKSDIPEGFKFHDNEKVLILDKKNTLFGFPF